MRLLNMRTCILNWDIHVTYMTLVHLTSSEIMFGVEYLKSEINTVLPDNLDASKESLS
jgi:hypothetical protein